MGKATQEQLDFIRQHGVTRCPPSTRGFMFWGGRPHARGPNGTIAFPEATEADLLRGLAAFDYRWPKGLRPHRKPPG